MIILIIIFITFHSDIINVKLAGEGLTAADGKVEISVVDLKYSLNNRLDDSSILLTVHKKPVVQFKSVSAQNFQLILNINGNYDSRVSFSNNLKILLQNTTKRTKLANLKSNRMLLMLTVTLITTKKS